MAPELFRQFRMFYHAGQPAAVVLYGFLSEEAEARLQAGAPSLREGDWRSGERAWIVEVIAPFGQAEAFVKETIDTVLPGREVRRRPTLTPGMPAPGQEPSA